MILKVLAHVFKQCALTVEANYLNGLFKSLLSRSKPRAARYGT